MSDALGVETTISGCGRTDAGVHASQFYFYLKTAEELPANFRFFMNKKLPNGIVFLEHQLVGEQAHVCLDATSRTYDYFLHDCCDPWLARMSSQVDLSCFKPDLCAHVFPWLQEQADFRQFCLTPDRHNSTIVDISKVTLFGNRERNRFRIRFVANRFLRGMIRVLVYDLLKIGNGELKAEQFLELLQGRDRGHKVHLAPPQGLHLTGVSYPYIERDPDLPLQQSLNEL